MFHLPSFVTIDPGLTYLSLKMIYARKGPIAKITFVSQHCFVADLQIDLEGRAIDTNFHLTDQILSV